MCSLAVCFENQTVRTTVARLLDAEERFTKRLDDARLKRLSHRQFIVEVGRRFRRPLSGYVSAMTYAGYSMFRTEIRLEPRDRQALLAIIRVYQRDRLRVRDYCRSDVELTRAAMSIVSSATPPEWPEPPSYEHYEANLRYLAEQQAKYREVLHNGGLDALLNAQILTIKALIKGRKYELPAELRIPEYAHYCAHLVRLADAVEHSGERFQTMLREAYARDQQ
jgi:hypothetical protein